MCVFWYFQRALDIDAEVRSPMSTGMPRIARMPRIAGLFYSSTRSLLDIDAEVGYHRDSVVRYRAPRALPLSLSLSLTFSFSTEDAGVTNVCKSREKVEKVEKKTGKVPRGICPSFCGDFWR